MGSAQSARRLTISNEDEVGAIKISNALVYKLAEASSTDHQAPKSFAPQEIAPVIDTKKQPAPPKSAHPNVDDVFDFNKYYTISALQMQKDMEDEIIEREAVWEKRLADIKKQHETVDQIIEKEYKEALKIFDNHKTVVEVHDAVKPCMNCKNQVIECYKQNQKESLKCSSLVQDFANCIDKQRAHLLKCN